MKQVTSTLFLFFALLASAQAQDRYMVFFKDKVNSNFSVNRPQEFLSERSLLRRTKNSVPVTEQDLPVNQSYVNQVAELGVETYFTTKWMNGVLVQMETNLVSAIESLDAVDRVEFVAPGTLLIQPGGVRSEFDESPVPPSLISQSQYEMLELDLMHQAGFFGEGVLLGVFDDGFNNYNTLPPFEHAILNEQIIYTEDFTKNIESVNNAFDHGLRAFSLIAADDQNIIGGAPRAEYFLAVTEAAGEFRIEEYNWLFAAERADSIGVDIITSSLGYSEFQDASMNYTVQDMDGQTAVVTRAANMAALRGIVVVTSAGNTGGSTWGIITAPADSENVIAVGAVDSDQVLAGFSALGPSADGRIKPDVVAQGVANPVLRATGNIAFQNGTSFSAPLIASLAAGLIEAFPTMRADRIREIIRSSGDRADSPNNNFGFGIPGFIKASRIADETLVPVADGISTYPNPSALSYINLAFPEEYIGQSIYAELMSNKGELVQSFRFTPGLFQNTIAVDLSKVKSGLLLLKLVTPGGIVTKKIIKVD